MRSRSLPRMLAVGASAALLAACSAEDVAERALESVEGVGDVELDPEDGSISVEGEDGEGFEVDIDEDGESSTITTQEGTITTAEDQPVPEELAAVFDPPEGYRIVTVSEVADDGDRIIITQGEIDGDWQSLMDDLEARTRAGDWDDVQVSAVAVGSMGSIAATRNDGTEGLNITLLQDENTPAAILGITYVAGEQG
ncbi:MAG: hypothetical protein ACLFS9_05315 [Nitriliruptoraceae bacterium]